MSDRKRGIFKSFQDIFERLAPGGLTPPQAVDFEQALLGACLSDKTSWENAYAVIGAHSTEESPFYRDAHTFIWQAICDLIAASEPVDSTTVTDRLRQQGKLDEIGGPIYLVDLTMKAIMAADVRSYAHTIRDRWTRRELIRISEMTKMGGFDNEASTSDLLDSSLDQLMKLSAGRSASSRPKKVSERVAVVLQHIGDAGKGALPGVAMGFPMMDALTYGLPIGSQTVLAAYPSEGKSALAANIVLSAVMRGEGVVLFSQEMKDIEIYYRLLAHETGISQHAIRGGLRNRPDADWRKVSETMRQLGSLPLWIDDTDTLTPVQIRARLRQITRSNDIELVVVDYLQLLNPSAPKENMNLSVASISKELKALWKDIDVAGLVLSQFSRIPSGSRGTHTRVPRPQKYMLRDSGAIEQDAHDLYFVYHPNGHEEGYKDQKRVIIELIRDKARGGQTGSFFMVFDKPTQSFTECEPKLPSESDDAYVSRMEMECRRSRFPVFDGQEPEAF